jgi:hypothetical protein
MGVAGVVEGLALGLGERVSVGVQMGEFTAGDGFCLLGPLLVCLP